MMRLRPPLPPESSPNGKAPCKSNVLADKLTQGGVAMLRGGFGTAVRLLIYRPRVQFPSAPPFLLQLHRNTSMTIKKSSTNSKETTSQRVASIASQALKNPESLTNTQIKTLAGSALTQSPDRKKPK